MNAARAVTGLALAWLLTSAGPSQAALSPFDPMDTCIYTCHYCFQDEMMVRCANDCLEAGDVSPILKALCPEFSMDLHFMPPSEFEDNLINSFEQIQND